MTFYWWLAASLVAGVLTVPSWGCLFRRHPVSWADEGAPEADGGEEKEKTQKKRK